MFRVSQKESYKWPVVVQEPNNGAFTESRFTAEFKILPQARLDSVAAGREENADLADEVLLGWDGVVDRDGNPLLFSEETKAIVLDIPYAKMAIVRAFFSSIAGRLPKT